MKRLLLYCLTFAVMFMVLGCGAYNSRQVAKTVPKDQSYCQRIGDMAVGMEPYMVKDKTILVFDNDLRKEEVLALNVSMLADSDTEYVVRKADINAIDEFGNEYAPMPPADVAMRIDRAMRSDIGLYDDIAGRDMPDEVTVSNELAQYFLFYDMTPNHADARELTVYMPAESADGSRQKAFRLTVDPMRAFMNPTEKWGSYDERGVTPCGMVARKVEPAPVAAAEAPNDEAAEKMERIFEKSLEK